MTTPGSFGSWNKKKEYEELQERAPMYPVNGLGGLMGGLLGAMGGEAAATVSSSAFSNPYYSQGTMEQLAYLQSLYPPDVKAKIKSLEEPKPVKETQKIELNPKRAVQLED